MLTLDLVPNAADSIDVSLPEHKTGKECATLHGSQLSHSAPVWPGLPRLVVLGPASLCAAAAYKSDLDGSPCARGEEVDLL